MILSLKNITKNFDEKIVLENFSHDFDDTGIVAITGPSGVGKTTLLRIICGLDKKYSGEVKTSDRVKFSVAFQEHRLFQNLTALENITEIVYQKSSEENVKASVDMLLKLGFTKDEMKLYPSALSGGMKQRVSLARAFLRDANIIILDEPTKELDTALVKQVLDIILDLSKHKLILIVTHNENDIEYLSAKIIKL